jgi:exoribonuclease R
LYQNGEAVVPMLPPALSEMALSLRAREEHVGVSLFCTWNTESKKLEIRGFEETVFTNQFTYTYETIYKSKEIPLEILQEIASSLRGSITTDSHDWIAECMILYNKEVAKKLLEHNVGLLRAHKPANAQKLQEFLMIHPDLGVLAYEAAKYELTAPNLLHAGLGSVPYCHASSPLRRYADLVNQRCLKAILQKVPIQSVPSELPVHLNALQKRMKAYERSLFFLEQVAKKPSGTVEALVISSTEKKTKVYVPAWKLMIPIDPGSYTTGQTISVEYYADLQKPYWDQRMVFRSIQA